jgi:glucan phosphoethanolaminetransferase (alkaline phosphatase superfamily)
LSWTPDDVDLLPKPKHSMLPLLVVLFLISYGLMATLVVEQGRTIDNQRSLIKELYTDSSQLSALKGKAMQKQHAEAQARAQANAHSQAQTPSSQGTPRDNAKSDRNARKLRRPAPQKPPTDTSDLADERRALVSI